MKKKQDLTEMVKEIAAVVKKHVDLKETPAVAVSFTTEKEGWGTVFFATNVSRADGIKLFEATAEKMRSQLN